MVLALAIDVLLSPDAWRLQVFVEQIRSTPHVTPTLGVLAALRWWLAQIEH